MHLDFVKRLFKATWVLELAIAVLILTATLLKLFFLGKGTFSQVLGRGFIADAFFADTMAITVGIGFVKMLVLHIPRAVTDVLFFAITWQLVVNHSNAMDAPLGVTTVALAFAIKKLLHTDGDDVSAGDGHP